MIEKPGVYITRINMHGKDNLMQILNEAKIASPVSTSSTAQIRKHIIAFRALLEDNKINMQKTMAAYNEMFNKTTPWLTLLYKTGYLPNGKKADYTYLLWRIKTSKKSVIKVKLPRIVSQPILMIEHMHDILSQTPLFLDLVMKVDRARLILNDNDRIIRNRINNHVELLEKLEYTDRIIDSLTIPDTNELSLPIGLEKRIRVTTPKNRRQQPVHTEQEIIPFNL